jgi:hypothetical protein
MTEIEQLWLQECSYKSATAGQDFLAAQARLQHSRNWNRPSIFFGAELRQDGDKWIASYNGVEAEGNCPEQAYLAFDSVWVGKWSDS